MADATLTASINELPTYPALSTTSDKPTPSAAPDSAADAGEQPRPERSSKVERELAELRVQAAQLTTLVETKLTPPAVAAPAAPLKRPRRADFDDPDSYDAAVDEWSDRVASRAADERVAAARATQETQRVAEDWIDRRSSALDRYDDYAEVAESPKTPMSMPMMHAIVNSERGPDIAYWLGKNQKEAARIAAIANPVRQALEIGRIEAQLPAEKPESKAAPAAARAGTRQTRPVTPRSAAAEPAETDSEARIERMLADMRKGNQALGWGGR